MWAALGDIRFELLKAPSSVGVKHGANFAEHGRVEGKPTLQWTGDGLDTVDLDVHLLRHDRIGNPDQRIAALKAALAAHAPLALTYGDGRYPGRFVITGLDVKIDQTADNGATVAATVKISLKEWVGEAGGAGGGGAGRDGGANGVLKRAAAAPSMAGGFSQAVATAAKAWDGAPGQIAAALEKTAGGLGLAISEASGALDAVEALRAATGVSGVDLLTTVAGTAAAGGAVGFNVAQLGAMGATGLIRGVPPEVVSAAGNVVLGGLSDALRGEGALGDLLADGLNWAAGAVKADPGAALRAALGHAAGLDVAGRTGFVVNLISAAEIGDLAGDLTNGVAALIDGAPSMEALARQASDSLGRLKAAAAKLSPDAVAPLIEAASMPASAVTRR